MKLDWKSMRIPIAECMILASVVGSVVFSFYLFFYEHNYNLAFFVGLWAPTLMGLVNYINIKFKT